MRHEKSQNLLAIALEMQGAVGLSLPDIQERFHVSRRTAERMRDAVMALFPQTEEHSIGDGLKRWRIPKKNALSSIPVSAEELAALRSAAEQARRQGLAEQANALDNVASKFLGLILPDARSKVTLNYEALAQAEGLASRAGPMQPISANVLADLRYAIKGCREVVLHYHARGSGAFSRLPVHPYGFLYGNRHYLVAFNPYEETEGYHLFSLPNIEKVEVQEAIFERDPKFDIDEYAAKSFGVFQEEPVNVVWRVLPKAAADARAYLFHPRQTIEEQSDGSLLVRFTAGGMLEMCWHLFTWEGKIQIVEPRKLSTMMREQLQKAQLALRPNRASHMLPEVVRSNEP